MLDGCATMGAMGLSRRKQRGDGWPGDPSAHEPGEALERAREALAQTGTYVDPQGNRRAIADKQRAAVDAALAEATEPRAGAHQPAARLLLGAVAESG